MVLLYSEASYRSWDGFRLNYTYFTKKSLDMVLGYFSDLSYPFEYRGLGDKYIKEVNKLHLILTQLIKINMEVK